MNNEEQKGRFAFTKINYILLIIGLVAVAIGFVLMTGPSTTATHFEPDIFSVRRIKIAPAITFLGYVFIIVAILFKKKENKN